MKTATITLVRRGGGKALLTIAGVESPFDSWQAASREAEAQGLRWTLERFEPTPISTDTRTPA